MPKWVSTIWFDIDHGMARFAAEDGGVPEPSVYAIDPRSGRGHLGYEVQDPIWIARKGRMKPRRLLKDLRSAFTTRLGADPSFRARMVKNPFFPGHRVIWTGQVYRMTYLSEWIERPKSAPAGLFAGAVSNANIDPSSREHRLWAGLCRWAYPSVHTFDNEDDFKSAARAQGFRIAASFNRRTPHEFSDEEVIYKAERVARWTWEHRHEMNCARDRGVMRLSQIPRMEVRSFWREVRRRQKEGARYAARIKADATRTAVEKAVRILRATGDPVTVPAVMHMIKRSRNTVRRYLRELAAWRAAA
jgi:hypothetical protein